MIFNDRAIADAIESGVVGVDPRPHPEQVQPASLDVRIGESVSLSPGESANVYTAERVTLPADVAALLTGRSSVGRQNVVVHQTAGWIDPGFDGNVLLEMYNHGQHIRTFAAGDRVAQLVFMQLAGESSGYDGQYQGQTPESDTPGTTRPDFTGVGYD